MKQKQHKKHKQHKQKQQGDALAVHSRLASGVASQAAMGAEQQAGNQMWARRR